MADLLVSRSSSLLARWTSLATSVLVTTIVVLGAHAIAAIGAPFDKITDLTPQFLALFALGVLAVQLGSGARAASRLRLPLGATGLAAFSASCCSP